MGGKVWSKEEEKVFWRIIIPQSVKRAGIDVGIHDPKRWDHLVPDMNLHAGAEARRNYTGLMLCKTFLIDSLTCPELTPCS
jgi:hypothetical protein